MSSDYRIEKDSMGEINIPDDRLWGAQTQRAVENFSVSPYRIPREFLKAMSLIKETAAEVNNELGLIDSKKTLAITSSCRKIREESDSLEDFPVDVFQTGSGTSWNMNVNEVIANMANESLGEPRGTRRPVHPNDHVNRGQSSNDVIPSALNLSNRQSLEPLLSALETLIESIQKKAEEWIDIVKLGRTHLQDAVPMTLGQGFTAYICQLKSCKRRITNTFTSLEELPLGGTAIGTGLNTHPEFAQRTAKKLTEKTGIDFHPAPSLFEGISARDAQLELMGALNSLATALMKIAQDLRLLSSGPRAGLAEIQLPALQPGSSIMPGKINPVIPEMVLQTAAFIAGKYTAVTIACQNSPLELNIMQPLLAHETLTSIELLTNTMRKLDTKCIRGLSVNEEQCRDYIEWSLALTTPLALSIGYDKAAALAKKAFSDKKTVRQVVEEEGILSPEEAGKILDPRNLV